MSNATPLEASTREGHYLAQTGRSELTPAQRRRIRHKEHETLRVEGRHGRLRRRYDAADERKVRTAAAQRVATIRGRIAFARFATKYTTEQKAQRRGMRRLLAFDRHQRDLKKQSESRNRERAS